MKTVSLLLCLFGSFWLITAGEPVPGPESTNRVEGVESAQPRLPEPGEGRKWRLVWSDKFDGAHLDETKWEAMGDWKRRDGFWTKADAYLDGGGNLLLRTRKDGDRYCSGAVRTLDRFEHAFGYWEVRCRLPKQPGHWPAFWLMCKGVHRVGEDGRDGTEIDIVEVPWRTGRITMNLHWDGYGDAHQSIGANHEDPGLMSGFHTFGLLWNPDGYVFYTDGLETWRTDAGGVSRVPEYIKLTEEIGAWGGDIGKAVLPDYFTVDYVRVYAVSGGN